MLDVVDENETQEDIEDPPEGLFKIKEIDIKDRERDFTMSSSSLVSNEYRDHDLDDEEEDNDYHVKFTQETFVLLLNKFSEALMVIGFFLLISLWISNAYDYNFFPFEINKVNNWWYQSAQIIFLASYWTTNIILLRLLIILGYGLFIIWAVSVGGDPSMDFYLFTYIYVLINIKKIVELLYKKRPIVFDEFKEQIYTNTFEGIMTRDEFRQLVNTALIRELPKGAFYCKIRDKCNSLSILIKGRIRIFKNSENIKTTFINENEFIDGAEWLLKYKQTKQKKTRGRRFNYFMKADDECIYLTWPREILFQKLKEHPELETKLNGALGIDVSNKLFNNSSLY